MATIIWRKHRRKSGEITKTAVLNWSEGGRQCRKSLGPISAYKAEDYRLAKELELRTGATVFSYAPLFGEMAEEYITWRATEFPDSQFRVEQIIRDHLIPAFQYVAIDTLTPRQVEQYKANRLQIVSEGSVAKEVRTLKAILNKAVEWTILDFSPIKLVSPPRIRTSRPMHWYTMEQMQELYVVSGARQPVWQLMANTGIRRGEAAHLKIEHDRGESILIESTDIARTKSRKWREVPLSINARESLDILIERSNTDYVLGIATKDSWTQSFARDRDSAGLGGSLHSLRHTFGTHQGIKGTPVQVLKELMGHASIKTTEKYLHAAQQHLSQAIDGFSI